MDEKRQEWGCSYEIMPHWSWLVSIKGCEREQKASQVAWATWWIPYYPLFILGHMIKLPLGGVIGGKIFVCGGEKLNDLASPAILTLDLEDLFIGSIFNVVRSCNSWILTWFYSPICSHPDRLHATFRDKRRCPSLMGQKRSRTTWKRKRKHEKTTAGYLRKLL